MYDMDPDEEDGDEEFVFSNFTPCDLEHKPYLYYKVSDDEM